ncbi:MAG: MlaD family protein [Muribaculaceae bacterium]|nr:MlaD family protein [Muribaculaceae bacterium]
MKKIFSKELTIGLSVLIAIAILIVGIEYLKGINLFKPANYYVANYQNVNGLEVSAPVSIDGYKVGQVREINFNYEKPGLIEVVIAVNKNLQIPEDTQALIETSILSGASVNLKLGKSNKMLPVGGEITTITPSDLMSSLQNDLMPQINSILPRVDSLLYNLNVLVTNPAIASSINRFDGISQNLLLSSQGLNTTLNRDIPGVMGNVKRISFTVDSIATNLGELSYQLKRLPLESSMQNVETVTQNLVTLSNQLNSKDGTLGKLMNDPELYNRLNRVTADIDSLIVDIKKNPKRYISIKLL